MSFTKGPAAPCQPQATEQPGREEQKALVGPTSQETQAAGKPTPQVLQLGRSSVCSGVRRISKATGSFIGRNAPSMRIWYHHPHHEWGVSHRSFQVTLGGRPAGGSPPAHALTGGEKETAPAQVYVGLLAAQVYTHRFDIIDQSVLKRFGSGEFAVFAMTLTFLWLFPELVSSLKLNARSALKQIGAVSVSKMGGQLKRMKKTFARWRIANGRTSFTVKDKHGNSETINIDCLPL